MKDFILIDGFKIKTELWEEIKDSYIATHPYEQEIFAKFKNCVESTAQSIEHFLLEEDYIPQSSNQVTQNIAQEFLFCPIVESIINDEVRQETLYEIICGISNKKKDIIVAAMIETAILEIVELNDLLSH